MLKIAVYPADDGGCGFYRMREPVRVVRNEFGDLMDVRLGDEWDPIVCAWTNGPFTGEPLEHNVPTDIMSCPDVDVMVFQRPLRSKYKHIFKLLRRRGIAIIVDLDDNFDRIDPANVSWSSVQQHWVTKSELHALMKLYGDVRVTRASADGMHFMTPDHLGATNRLHLNQALQFADMVTVSTPSLRDHYSRVTKAHVMVNENCVPHTYTEIPRIRTGLTPVLTWTGSVLTHPRDLREVRGAIEQLRADNVDFKLRIVGTGNGISDAIGVEADSVTGWVDLTDYPREYAQADVAICPLENTEFNRGKSWLKAIEAASLGVIPVMSPLPEYRSLNQTFEIGRIARRTREWYGALKHLLTCKAEREFQSRCHREIVRSRLTYEARASVWANAWSTAVKRRCDALAR